MVAITRFIGASVSLFAVAQAGPPKNTASSSSALVVSSSPSSVAPVASSSSGDIGGIPIYSSSSSSAAASVKLTSSAAAISSTSAAASPSGTQAPAGNTQIYSDLTSIPSSNDKLGSYTLSTYSAFECQQLCAQTKSCKFYNIYNAASTNAALSGSTPYCALYSQQHTAGDATDFGSAGLSYSGSAGYAMVSGKAVTVATGNAGAPTAPAASAASSSSSAMPTANAKVVSSAAVASSPAASPSSPAVASPPAASSSAAAASMAPAAMTASASVASSSPGLLAGFLASTTTSAASSTSMAPFVTEVPLVNTSACSNLPSWAWPEWCLASTSIASAVASNAANGPNLQKGFIIPLYIYPSWWMSPGAWDWVSDIASQQKSVLFTVIINPSSGPGTSLAPNSDYQHEISRLRAIPNIQMLGYVDTAYGTRDSASVSSDIATYAGWSSVSPNFAMDGIMFDNQPASSSHLKSFQKYASQVRSNSGFSGGKIVGFSPGGPCHPSYLDVADFVIVFNQVSNIVHENVFGWYRSFLTGLTTAQLAKTGWLLTSADSGTVNVVSNIQAAFNSRWIYVSDSTASWGGAFQGAVTGAVLSKALALIANPLALTQ